MASRESVAWCGLAGAGLVAVGCLASALLFEHNGSRYSPLGCFISELGDVQHSRGHAAFNGALMLSAAPLLYFMVGLGQRFSGWVPRLGQASGGIAAIGGFFVGFFPMNQLGSHMAAANTFFYGGMLTMFLYSRAIYVSNREVPRAMSGFGIAVGVMFATFLFLPLHFYVGPAPTLFKAEPYQHPLFWLIAFVEWLVLLSILSWVASVSVLLLRSNPTGTESPGARCNRQI